jgi:hypothetical protein
LKSSLAFLSLSLDICQQSFSYGVVVMTSRYGRAAPLGLEMINERPILHMLATSHTFNGFYFLMSIPFMALENILPQ